MSYKSNAKGVFLNGKNFFQDVGAEEQIIFLRVVPVWERGSGSVCVWVGGGGGGGGQILSKRSVFEM